MNIKESYKNMRYSVRDVLINSKYRSRLINKEFSIISCDCLGGVLCKDLKVRMDSPTRNLYFNASDFVKFCKHLDDYLELSLTPYDDPDSPFITAKLGDVELFLVHYKSFEQAYSKWEERKQRVHRDNLFFYMNDRNLCNEQDIKAFNELSYENKVIFTHKAYPDIECAYHLQGSENDSYVKDVTSFIHQWWIKRYYDQFDFVSWLNNGGHTWT